MFLDAAQLRRHLVATDVHRAEDHAVWADFLDDPGVDFRLLYFGWEVRGVEVEELGAVEADAARALGFH